MAREHITNVVEFMEEGILLLGGGEHVVRVLGALREVPLPGTGPKETLGHPGLEPILARYYAGQLAGDQEDPAGGPENPRVPAFFITNANEPLFLERDWSGATPGPPLPPSPPRPAPSGPVSPSSAPVEGGTRLRIAGSDLQPGTSVTIGGTPAEAVQVIADGSAAFAESPAMAAGTYDVVVASPGTDPVTYEAGLTYFEDVSSAARAAFESYGNALAEARARADHLRATSALDSSARDRLQGDLDLARERVLEVIQLRAEATGQSQDSAAIGQVLAEALPRIRQLAEQAQTSLA